jgi:hypothetical protein
MKFEGQYVQFGQNRLALIRQVRRELALMRHEMRAEGYKLWVELPWIKSYPQVNLPISEQ